MDRNDLLSLLGKLYSNDTISFSTVKIFSILTGEQVTTLDDYEIWVRSLIDEMGLIDGTDYSVRRGSDVFVRGRVGLNILMRGEGEIPHFFRFVCERLHIDVRMRVDETFE